MKEDVPYYLDSSGNVQDDLAPELLTEYATTSGKNTILWLGNLYVPAGDQTLLEIGTSNTFRNPSDFATNAGEYVGKVQALGADAHWLFAAVDNSTKIEILKGRLETVDGTTAWTWHPFVEITLAGAETMHVSTVVRKALWIASTSSSDSLYYIKLPTGYGDVTNDSNRSFKTSTEFETPWLDGNFPTDDKGFTEIKLWLGHTFDTNIYYEAHYKKLQDSSFTDIGDFKGTATDRRPTGFLPSDGSSNKPTSTHLKLKFVAKTDDAQKAPVLLGYDLRGILYPARRRQIIACTIRFGDNVSNNDGLLEKNYKEIKDTINSARTADWPITIKDIWGDEQKVKFLPIPRRTGQFRVIKKEKDRILEAHYDVLMQIEPSGIA